MNAIVKLQPTTWNMIQTIAASAKASGKLNIFKQEEAEIKMLTAWENGLPLTSAFQTVHIINNVPSLSPKAIWGKIMISPEFGGYQEDRLVDAKGNFLGYKITLTRKNGVTATRQFTMEDAKRAKLETKDNWIGYAEAMCYWRAQGFAQDAVFPDITLGMVRADALGADVTIDGEVIESSWKVQPQTPTRLPIQDLLDKYSPETIIGAAGGSLPQTKEQCDAVAAILEAQLDPITIESVVEVEP